MQPHEVILERRHDLFQFPRIDDRFVLVADVINILLSVTVNSRRKNLVGATTVNLEYAVAVRVSGPVSAGGAAARNGMPPEAFDPRPGLLTDEIIRQFYGLGHVNSLTSSPAFGSTAILVEPARL